MINEITLFVQDKSISVFIRPDIFHFLSQGPVIDLDPDYTDKHSIPEDRLIIG